MRESQRRAAANYKAKHNIKTIRFELFPTETDIKEHLEAKKAEGEATATYLKRLIREDMKRGDKPSEKE